MSPDAVISPNDPCPCGSGKKYKRCCEIAEGPTGPKWKRVAFGGLVVVGIGVLVFGPMFGEDSGPSTRGGSGSGAIPVTATAPVSTPASTPAAAVGTRPDGPAPAGKVWSEEHGHWHDAPPPLTGPGSVPVTQAGVLSPQPPGPVPPGKVWSAEHGHWHDAPAGLGARPPARSFTPAPQPDGPVPEGKVWSVEHGHWHDAPAAQSDSSAAADVPPITIDFSPKTP